MLVDIAIKALIKHGVTFDEKSNIVEISPDAEKYLQQKTTPEFVLFTIVIQRRYTASNRRKACTWIRRQLLIIQTEFSAKERSNLALPICTSEEACKMDSDGFKSVSLLDTLSSAENDETQNQHVLLKNLVKMYLVEGRRIKRNVAEKC